MKKFLSGAILMLSAMLPLSSMAQSDTLVAYFSCTGNTQMLAKNLAQAIGADLYEIKPAQPYTEADLNWHDKSSRTTIEQNDPQSRPAIDGKIENFSAYKQVIISFPVWWDLEPRIIDTFIESYDFTGKLTAAVCTSGGSSVNGSLRSLKEKLPKAVWAEDNRCFRNGTSETELREWAAGNHLGR